MLRCPSGCPAVLEAEEGPPCPVRGPGSRGLKSWPVFDLARVPALPGVSTLSPCSWPAGGEGHLGSVRTEGVTGEAGAWRAQGAALGPQLSRAGSLRPALAWPCALLHWVLPAPCPPGQPLGACLVGRLDRAGSLPGAPQPDESATWTGLPAASLGQPGPRCLPFSGHLSTPAPGSLPPCSPPCLPASLVAASAFPGGPSGPAPTLGTPRAAAPPGRHTVPCPGPTPAGPHAHWTPALVSVGLPLPQLPGVRWSLIPQLSSRVEAGASSCLGREPAGLALPEPVPGRLQVAGHRGSGSRAQALPVSSLPAGPVSGAAADGRCSAKPGAPQ